MTTAPDLIDTAATEPLGRRRPRLFGLGFWAAIVFGLICIAGGYALARLGPDLLRVRPAATPAPAPVVPASEPVHVASAPPASAVAPVPTAGASAEVGVLGSRISELEGGQDRLAQAAAAALAAAALSDAAAGPRPFAAELATVETLLPASQELAALRPLARIGAPTPAALALELDSVAGRAAAAARQPGEGAGLLARGLHALSSIVTIRYVGSTTGTSADAVLARIERLTDEGDLDGALRAFSDLPPATQAVLAEWRVKTERRAEIDRRIAAVRAQALAVLTQARRAA